MIRSDGIQGFPLQKGEHVMSINKIERFVCCGMDVHKDILVATIGITDRSTLITQYVQETFNSQCP